MLSVAHRVIKDSTIIVFRNVTYPLNAIVIFVGRIYFIVTVKKLTGGIVRSCVLVLLNDSANKRIVHSSRSTWNQNDDSRFGRDKKSTRIWRRVRLVLLKWT